jgi:PPP family 3-phenylpropionic acid transporter
MQGGFYAAFGCGVPFFSIYYKHILVSADGSPAVGLIGVLFFVNAVAGIVSMPLLGYLADRFKIRNRLVSVLAAIVALFMVPVAVAGTPWAMGWSLEARALATFLGFGIAGLAVRPIMPLMDSETLAFLRASEGGTTRYGRIRAWGTVGFIITATGVGVLLNATGALYLGITAYSLGFVGLVFIASGGFRAILPPVRIPLEHLFHDRTFRRYLVFVFFTYLAFTNAFTFTGYFLDDAEVNLALIGLSFALGAVAEVPIMQGSHRLIGRLRNTGVIMAGALTTAFKLILFVIGDAAGALWLLVGSQVLNGVGFGMMFVGFVSFVDQQAHPDLAATYQNLHHVAGTAGFATGMLVAPLVIEAFGSRTLMGVDAALLLVCVAYFVTVVRPNSSPEAVPGT